MTEDRARQIYDALRVPFPLSDHEKSLGKETGRKYNTTGIGYQHIVDRLNDVVGIGNHRVFADWQPMRQFKYKSGRLAFSATVDVRIELGQWTEGKWVPWAEARCVGGHIADNEGDARKGAYTNGFKKTAAFFGVGREFYSGELDDLAGPEEDIEPISDEPDPEPERPIENIAERVQPSSADSSQPASLPPILLRPQDADAAMKAARSRDELAEIARRWNPNWSKPVREGREEIFNRVLAGFAAAEAATDAASDPGGRLHCAQCYLNGSGKFYLTEDGLCPNPKCVLKTPTPPPPDKTKPAEAPVMTPSSTTPKEVQNLIVAATTEAALDEALKMIANISDPGTADILQDVGRQQRTKIREAAQATTPAQKAVLASQKTLTELRGQLQAAVSSPKPLASVQAVIALSAKAVKQGRLSTQDAETFQMAAAALKSELEEKLKTETRP